ncbi:hypothetical protein [Sulfitobacter aestuariivivens]|uniref:hypothetical protein n=1 Tax=Sulfitobacter aestuariivivens TaxID=2766981 RepID=UPI00361A0D96
MAIDSRTDRLARLAVAHPERIEPLVIADGETDKLSLLKDAWADEPITLVVNLMPLSRPVDISAQMRALSMVLRTTLRGLVAGKGTLATVVARPGDPLALNAQGLCGAVARAGEAVAAEVHAKGVRVHTLSVPAAHPGAALGMLIHLGSGTAQNLKSTTFHLD